MIEQELMSPADMLHSPMAAASAADRALPREGGNPLNRLLRPYAALVEQPVPKSLQELVDHYPMNAQPVPRDP